MNVQGRALRRPASYQAVLDAPPGMVAEIIRGALHLQPRPRHSTAISGLGYDVVGRFGRRDDGPGDWIILIEPELHLGENVLVPELAGWRRERLTPFPEEVGIITPPDWVCAVLSPATRSYDLTDKRDGAWVLSAALRDGAEVRVAPFDAVTFGLAGLWAP